MSWGWTWYRIQLKKQISPLIEKWEQIMEVQVNSWQVRQMKTRWCSCNPDQKQIQLNLELAKKPIPCLEYIIVHEMIHLLERLPSTKSFWFIWTDFYRIGGS